MKKAEIGRNDPCSCGSGLKYKKCCMGNSLKRKVSVISSGGKKQVAEPPIEVTTVDLFQRAIDIQASEKAMLRRADFSPTKHNYSASGVEQSKPDISKRKELSEEEKARSDAEDEAGRLKAAERREEPKFHPTTKDYSEK